MDIPDFLHDNLGTVDNRLMYAKRDFRQLASKCLAKFFENYRQQTREALSWLTDALVNYRTRMLTATATKPTTCEIFREINFFDCAWASVECENFVTALMFFELWTESAGREGVVGALQTLENGIDDSTVVGQVALSEVYTLLCTILNNIDEPDGYYGLEHPMTVESFQRQWHREGSWEKCFSAHEVGMLVVDVEWMDRRC